MPPRPTREVLDARSAGLRRLAVVTTRGRAVTVLLATRLPLVLLVIVLREQAVALVALLVACVVLEVAMLWKVWPARHRARLQEAEHHGHRTVQAELERTDQIRTDLIGTVSHEFRTPLTGIRGAALTLLKRGERLDDQARRRLLEAVLEQEERLSRLLENMLMAAQATAADPGAAAELDAVAAEVAMLAGAARPETPPVTVVVARGTLAQIDRQALHQVLANLIDNAQQHGAQGSVPVVAGGTDELGTWLSVSNEGTTLDSETARRLFDPFTQADTGPTREREGLGMGLYVVRRLVEVHGGSIVLRSEDGWTTVEIRLADPLRARPAPVAPRAASSGRDARSMPSPRVP